MAAPAALLAVKAAVAVAADKRGRNVLASIVAAVLVPFVLVIIMLLSIMDGTSSHNVSAVDLVFRDGVISSQVPEEYRKYIVDMRTSFTSLEDVIAGIDHVEDGELDTERIKSVYYAMYFGSAQPSLLAQKEFVDCFVEYEEREDEDADEKKAVIVEVNAETDFVAKNEKFQTYVADVAAQALTTSAKDLDAFMEERWAKDETLSVKEALASQIAIIGENMNIRRFEQVEEANGFVASYIHAGGKIGVLVDVETDVVNDDIKDMAKNVAMQAAALKPMFTSRDEVSADYIAKETEILTAAAKNEKPDANDKIIEGMVKGRINKELKETCLLDQVYVKAEDGKQSVSQYVAAVAKANGASIKVKKFIRFETGEGLEKKSEDFAAEVAKQMGM